MKKAVFALAFMLLFLPHCYALRIVSLSPAVTEIIFKLGAGNDVVGDTLFSNYPEEARKLPKVGSYVRPNLEKILALHPDYVMGMQETVGKDVEAKLNEIGIKVRLYSAENITDIVATIKSIAKIVQKNPSKLIKRINNFYKTYPKAKKTAVFLVSINPLIASTQNTFINSIMKCAKIKNIVREKSLEFIIINKEFIIKNQPDFIIVSLGVQKQIEEAKNLIKRFHLKSKLLIVNPDIYNRPSYRIVDACMDLRKKTALH